MGQYQATTNIKPVAKFFASPVVAWNWDIKREGMVFICTEYSGHYMGKTKYMCPRFLGVEYSELYTTTRMH